MCKLHVKPRQNKKRKEMDLVILMTNNLAKSSEEFSHWEFRCVFVEHYYQVIIPWLSLIPCASVLFYFFL